MIQVAPRRLRVRPLGGSLNEVSGSLIPLAGAFGQLGGADSANLIVREVENGSSSREWRAETYYSDHFRLPGRGVRVGGRE